jgi:hypothetical protein
MVVEPSPDWSVFKQIFADRWEALQQAHPRYQTSYYNGLVARMLACGNPEQMGYVEYRCQQCGQGVSDHGVEGAGRNACCVIQLRLGFSP